MTDAPPNTRRAWVTGAGTGIGRAVAKALAARGWDVAVSARTVSDLESLAAESLAAEMPGRVTAFPLDVTDAPGNERVVADIEATLGPLDLVVLNAGTYFPVTATNFTAENFKKTIDVNLNGTAYGLSAVLPRMTSRKRGHIAIVASLTGLLGLPTSSAYGATKAALNNMAEALKVELEPYGVTMTIINPGFVRTPLTDKNDFPMPFLVELDDAAEIIVKGLEAGKYEIIFPWQMALIFKLLRVFPRWLQFALTRRMVRS